MILTEGTLRYHLSIFQHFGLLESHILYVAILFLICIT